MASSPIKPFTLQVRPFTPLSGDNSKSFFSNTEHPSVIDGKRQFFLRRTQQRFLRRRRSIASRCFQPSKRSFCQPMKKQQSGITGCYAFAAMGRRQGPSPAVAREARSPLYASGACVATFFSLYFGAWVSRRDHPDGGRGSHSENRCDAT
jgi:hypothetical protein